MASRALGLRHNPVEAVRATRDKSATRRLLAAAGRPGPRFSCIALDADPVRAAAGARYPCVLKPLSLSTGRGVIRADDPAQFVAAFRRIRRILLDPDVARLKGATGELLVEDYLAGQEFALEGLLEQGRLRVLALFDKPDPMDGPTFEETLLVTPSRQPSTVQRAIVEEVRRSCAALGLRHGPVHAELRLTDGKPWLIELGARTIGGLCSSVLRFGDDVTLEQLVLLQTLGRDLSGIERESAAVGVMMLPIPEAGILGEVRGVDEARSVAHVQGVTISLHRGAAVVPLPEGHSYLGFVFARAETADQVEAALRQAHRCLKFEIQNDRTR
jgi:biotin carboxylase